MADSSKRQHEDSDDEFVGPMPAMPESTTESTTESITKKRKGSYHTIKQHVYLFQLTFPPFFHIETQSWSLKIST